MTTAGTAPRVTGWNNDATGGFTAAIGVYALAAAIAAATRETSADRLTVPAESAANS